MTINIATIWGWNSDLTNLPVFSTHHSFWEETIRDRKDCTFTRFTWENFRDMPKDFDLYFFIDYNQELFSLYQLPFKNTCFYWWDAHHHSPFTRATQIVPLFDRSYIAESSVCSYLKSEGYNVKWLPASFYPGVYKPLSEEKILYDFAFVGQFDHIVRRHGLTRYDFINKLLQEFNGMVSDNMFSVNINKTFNQSKILFERTVPTTLGTRFFEMIGSGKFTLMNRVAINNNSVDLLAVDGLHYVSYDDTYQDFIQKFRYYLNHEEERLKIQSQGYDFFLKNHTYNHRLNVILQDFNLI